MISKRPSRAKNGVKLPTDVSNIPQPENGSQYTLNETVKLLKVYPETSKKKSHLIIHLEASNLVPIQRDGVCRLLRKKNEKNLVRLGTNRSQQSFRKIQKLKN